MRFPILFIFSLFLTVTAKAQVAPDFTVTDINGEEHTLYQYLDEGKVVILDFFAVWCGPCQEWAPAIESIWETRGPGGTDEVMILGLEADDDTEDFEVAQYAIDYNCNNPQINDTGDLNDIYGIDYYPTYYVICPDRTIHQYEGETVAEVGQVLNAGIDECAPYLLFDVDARIYSYNSATTVCDEFTIPNIKLMNMGQSMLSSLEIEVHLNGVMETTTSWTGSLDLFESENVSLPSVDLTGTLDPEISVSIESPNGIVDPNPDNDMVSVPITYGGTSYETEGIHFELAFDNFPQETSWEIKDSEGSVVHAGDDYIGFPDFSPPIDTMLSLPMNDCYTFTIYDDYGDGICCNFADPGEGYWRISSSNGVLIGEGGVFTDEESLLFGAIETVGLSEYLIFSDLSVYPNPSEGSVSIDLSSVTGPSSIEIYGPEGRLLEKIEFLVGDLYTLYLNVPNGLYSVVLRSNNEQRSAKVIIE